jgi:hypothetical protein
LPSSCNNPGIRDSPALGGAGGVWQKAAMGRQIVRIVAGRVPRAVLRLRAGWGIIPKG